MIMAPFLAVGGYGLADLYITSQDEIKNYKLFPKGPCKPVKDACEVEGVGLSMNIRFNEVPKSGEPLPITLVSKTRLDDIALSVVSAGTESVAVGARHGEYRKTWNTLPVLPELGNMEGVSLRLAISEQGHMHFAEIPLVLK